MADEQNRPPRPVRVRSSERMAQRLIEKPSAPGPDLHAAVVDPDPEHETAELPAKDLPLLGSESSTHVDEPSARPDPVLADPAEPYHPLAAKLPTHDQTISSEPITKPTPLSDFNLPPSSARRAKKDGASATSAIVTAAEEVDRIRREASEAAAAKLASTDFQVGGEEKNYLQGGVPVEHVTQVAESFAARERRSIQKAMDRLRGRR